MKNYDHNGLVMVSLFLTALSILFGILGFTSGKELTDNLFNLGTGVIFILVAFAAHRGKLLAAYLIGFQVIASLFHSFLMGRGVNYVTICVGFVWAYWLHHLWKNGELK